MASTWHGALLVGMASVGFDPDEAAQRLIEEGVDAGLLAEIEEFVRELDLEPSARDRTRLLVERTRILAERADADARTSDRLRTGTRDVTADSFDDFATLWRHELSTPLAVAETALSTLVARQQDPATVARMVEVAQRNLFLARHLVNSLSTFGDLQVGHVELTWAQVDLGALVREAIDDVGPVLAGHHGIEVDVEPGVEAPADRNAVRQVLVNLLTNAAKFSPDRSGIKVTVSTTSDFAEIGVRDVGPGFSPEEEERIFEAGQRLDPAVPGMGVGLFIARQLARAHGGDLGVQRPEGGGARFVLRLPLGPSEWQRSLERREGAAIVRDTDLRARTATADARDVTLVQREATADQRDATLAAREAIAAERDAEDSVWSRGESRSSPGSTPAWEGLAEPLSSVAMRLRSLRARQAAGSAATDELDRLIAEVDRVFGMVMRR